MRQIEALTQAIKSTGISAKVWKDSRIYLSGFGRDITAYITLDEPLSETFEHLFQGCALKVFTDCNQSANWKMNRYRQVKHSIMITLDEAGITSSIGSVCENASEVMPQ